MNSINKLIIIIISLFTITNVYAYSNDLYDINIPNKYKENDKIFTLTEGNIVTNLYITTEKNTDSVNVSNYDNSNLKILEEKFKNKINTSLVKVSSIDSYLDNKNKYSRVIVDITSSYIIDDKEITLYQREYIYSSKNYIYYITVSTSSLDKINSKEIIDIVNSFKIKDEVLKKDLSNYLVLVILLISSVLLIYILKKKTSD